ncbi:MAG: sugar ABC transporter substrate-binding protein [Spirochaeta sp.]|jgi:ribose transport system substrate-binding protein|nr:sugar ABC transporter substrate-binding protein [Spirochaeta sp.]
MRKNLIVLLGLVLVATMVFGAGQQEDAAADDGKIVIGHTANNVGIDSYQTTHDQVFRETCEEMADVECIQLDPGGDVALQLSQVEDLIQQQVDVIAIWPVNGKALVPGAKKAYDAGIPVVIVNSLIDESGYDYVVGFAGPDTYEEGVNGARAMIEALDGQGKVVELMGLPGYVTAIRRSDGFQDHLAENAPGIEILATEPTDWNRAKATTAMENLLVRFGDEIDGVYVADDNVGIGALNAMKEAGVAGDIVITSACMFGEGYDAMAEGFFYGSVYQSPAEDARNAVEMSVAAAKGEEVPFWNYFETPVVTPENMDQFERPNF